MIKALKSVSNILKNINTAAIKTHSIQIQIILFLLLISVVIISLMLGRMDIHPFTVIKILFSEILPIEKIWSSRIESVVIDVRFPRVMAALLIGAGLSVSGASFQGIFRNPLVSPDILGVASGAGFGAAIAILFFDNIVTIQIFSFAFGLLAVGLTYSISRVYSAVPVLMLVLSGIIVGALFSAMTSLTKYVADPMDKMPAIVFWLLGSLNNITNKNLLFVSPFFIVCMGAIYLIRWRINILSMGDEDAKTLGVNIERLKGIIIICATIITAASVSLSGIIGWVGLVIPHLGRLLVGSDNKILIPVTMLIGSSYLIIVDIIARTAIASEIPIGIITAIFGAPIFAYLLRKNQIGR
jgi:iron complex transport system permease protein